MKSLKTVLIVFAILAMAVVFSACAEMGTIPPPPPPPDDSKYYDLQVEYIRPVILYPEGLPYQLMPALVNSSGEFTTVLMTKIDDCHFKCEFAHVKGAINYYFHQMDRARYDGSDYSSFMVGDIFIVTVKQTGFVKELKDIRPYNLPANPYPGPKAKAAFLTLTKDGIIISDAQSSNR